MQAPVRVIQTWDREWRTGWCEHPRRCRLRLQPDNTESERAGGARPTGAWSSGPEDGRELPGPKIVCRATPTEFPVPRLKMRWFIQHGTALADPIRNPFDHFLWLHNRIPEKAPRLADVTQRGGRAFR